MGGQQGVARLHQGFDLFGGVVEARGQKAHLIIALHAHPGTQIPVAPALNPVLQRFQPAGQTADDGVSAQRHRDRDQRKRPGKAEGRLEIVVWRAG